MNHDIQTFKFVKDKKVLVINARPYTFEIEDVLIKRFGLNTIKKFAQTGNLVFDVTLGEVKEDLPKLLDMKGAADIDWKKQNFDEIARVYYFFLEYKRNVNLRALKLEAETLRSQIQELATLMSSAQENILKATS
ncbi:MAG: hypothetical protein HXY50_00465 [Ignavibacteriaceae bacterium]|nr:hypothetical protein [Ignavibacteriaceae bacterium]